MSSPLVRITNLNLKVLVLNLQTEPLQLKRSIFLVFFDVDIEQKVSVFGKGSNVVCSLKTDDAFSEVRMGERLMPQQREELLALLALLERKKCWVGRVGRSVCSRTRY